MESIKLIGTQSCQLVQFVWTTVCSRYPPPLCVCSEISSEIREKKFIEHFWFSFHKILPDDVERWKCTTRGCKAYFKQNSIGERYDEHLDHNHEQLDVSVLRSREISNSLKRKAQENLHERPAKLLRSELVPNDSHVLTTQDVNAIVRQYIMYVQNYYQHYLNRQRKRRML